MHEHYGIDLDSPNLLESRSSRWLIVRIKGLLSIDSRLRHALVPDEDES